MLVPHNKPKGGRNKAAKFPTTMWRIPIGLKPAIEDLAALYRSENWDGNLANLNYGLITGIEITNVSALVLNLVSAVRRNPDCFQDIPPSIKSDFVREVGAVLGDKPDSGNDIVVSLQDELKQKEKEIAQLKEQLSNSNKPLKVVIDESGIDKLRSVVGDKDAEINKLTAVIESKTADNANLLCENKELLQEKLKLQKELDDLSELNSNLKVEFLELKSNYARLKIEKNWLDKMYQILTEATQFPAQRGGAIKRTIEFAILIATGKYIDSSVDEGFNLIKKSIVASGDKQSQNQLLKKAVAVLKTQDSSHN
ncbi:MAG TPA: hypothetical protein DCL61_21015 [Cyanobacteria bacterium UBA12227]|nr:hypothetical protein [Cyanobacteria bacterium UBA12227]